MAHHCDCCDVSDEEIAKLRADLATAEAAIAASESRGFARGVEEAARALLDGSEGIKLNAGTAEVMNYWNRYRGLRADLRAALSLPPDAPALRSHRCIDDGGDGYECPGCHARTDAPDEYRRGHDEGFMAGMRAGLAAAAKYLEETDMDDLPGPDVAALAIRALVADAPAPAPAPGADACATCGDSGLVYDAEHAERTGNWKPCGKCDEGRVRAYEEATETGRAAPDYDEHRLPPPVSVEDVLRAVHRPKGEP